METNSITFAFCLIFSGAAILASVALYTRQPMIIAYILLGAIIGPYGMGYVTDLNLLSDIAHFGIIFLLYLLRRFGSPPPPASPPPGRLR